VETYWRRNNAEIPGSTGALASIRACPFHCQKVVGTTLLLVPNFCPLMRLTLVTRENPKRLFDGARSTK
jgi:hypothetical protein